MNLRRILVALSMAMLGICLAGCCNGRNCDDKEFEITWGKGNNCISLDVEILDDCENRFFRTTAELWLKISKSDEPDIYLLYPLNVNKDKRLAGGARWNLRTPYQYDKDKETTLTIELLDDNHLSAKEEKLLLDTVNNGGLLIYELGKLYACEKANIDKAIDDEDVKNILKELLTSATKLTLENMNQHTFESLGHIEYKMPLTGHIFISNPITIIHGENRARCNLKFHRIADKIK